LAQVGDDDDEPALLLSLTTPIDDPANSSDQVFLNEEKATVNIDNTVPRDVFWYLDTGASNHMTGDVSSFTDIDTSIVGKVCFGDTSVVGIQGRGTVVFVTKQGHHRALMNVYYIPRLKSSIVSIGQLDEIGCRMLIEDGTLRMWDQQRKLLAKVNRSRNRLYMLPLSIAQPVCMKMCLEDESWRWHARYAHINFGALQLLARDGMVHGLPAIEHADELCEACLAGKQKRTPFPQQAQYWVT
jgi:hypothetical protein